MDIWNTKSLSQFKTLPPNIPRGSQIWQGKPGTAWHRLSSWAFYPGSRVGYVEDMVLSHWRFSLLQVTPLSPPRDLQGRGDRHCNAAPGLCPTLSLLARRQACVDEYFVQKKKRCLDSMIKLHFCKKKKNIEDPQMTFMLAISLSVPVSFPKPFSHSPLSCCPPPHAHLYLLPSLIAWW